MNAKVIFGFQSHEKINQDIWNQIKMWVVNLAFNKKQQSVYQKEDLDFNKTF